MVSQVIWQVTGFLYQRNQRVVLNGTILVPLFFLILFSNYNLVNSTTTQKRLEMVLDAKLDFKIHLQNFYNKANKMIGHVCKLHRVTLRRASLITICKSFIRRHQDYGHIIYDQTYDNSLHQKMESIQYKASLDITDAITKTAMEKLYQELGLEFLLDWILAWATFLKKNYNTVFVFVFVGMKLKQLLTNFFIVPAMQTKEWPHLTKSGT